MHCDFLFGERSDFGCQLKIMAVGGQFGAVPRKCHSILEFRGRAPDFPPQSFRFQEIADGVFGLLLLQAQRRRATAFKISGIDLAGYCDYVRVYL